MNKQIAETELHELETYCSNITKVGLEPVTRLISEVRERRAHEDRYRWHNLRKDPNDLPEVAKDVIVVIRNGESTLQQFGNTSYINKLMWHFDMQMYEPEFVWRKWEVIAWREIEPFEEVSE